MRYIVILMLTGLIVGCVNVEPPPVLVLHGQTMGTSYSVQIAQPPSTVALEALRQDIEQTLEDINAQMSTYRPESELSRFNHSASTDWQPVSHDLATVVQTAQEISELSGGAFDVTVGPLVNLWGFGPDPSQFSPPTAEDLAAARARVGYQQLEVRLDPPALRKQHPELMVDLSAIAKGYAVDRVAEQLDAAGISAYLVEIGGELRGLGYKQPDQPWRVAIERPYRDERTPLRVITLNQLALATSGDYRNYFVYDGRTYSHTIDPATGEPVTHDLTSVTVLDPSAMRADALATALLVLGPESGQQWAAQHQIAALFIQRRDDDSFVVTQTESFGQLAP